MAFPKRVLLVIAPRLMACSPLRPRYCRLGLSSSFIIDQLARSILPINMTTRTSSRQAAQKAKEAISTSSEAPGKQAIGPKRKAATAQVSEPKREKIEPEKPENGITDQQKVPGIVEDRVPGTEPEGKANPSMENPNDEKSSAVQSPKHAQSVESGVRKSEERENVVSSNILEKGIIYFFFRPRVNVDEPHRFGDVARSFFVLRPTPRGAELDQGQGPVDKDARCRLMIIPKKMFPTAKGAREMAYVEKAGQTMNELHDSFIAGGKYQTSTRGERTLEDARPYAEGVYAITSTRRASHLAYILTIPAELGDIQDSFGLRDRGSWIVQSKNPKYPGPAYAQLPKDPDYPESVREKFADLRWVPLEPEFLDYPNSQFLMIGEAQNELGKAASAEGGKQPHEEEPGQELEKLEQENESRVDALEGDETVYQDLGLDAKNYPQVPTTWNGR